MLIVHRCTGCRHPDIWGQRAAHPVLGLSGNLPANCGQGCHPKCQWNPQPETMRRLDHAGRTVTDILPPGSETRWYHAGTTHNCEACQALYTQLTADQPERTTTP